MIRLASNYEYMFSIVNIWLTKNSILLSYFKHYYDIYYFLRKGDPLKLWFNISAKAGRETKYYQVFLNSSRNTDPRCKQFWDTWNRYKG